MSAGLRWTYNRIYGAVNYRLRGLLGGRLAHLCRPTSISLLLTERCNARCVHCDIWKNKGKEDSLTLEEWQTVFRDLRRWLGPVQIVLTGGEALLKPYTVDLVAYGRSIGLLLEVLTHGYWSDQARIQALARANPWRVTVSFDAVNDIHSKIRGRSDFFEKTSRTIETLVRLRREERLGYEIRLKTVLMEHNLDAACEVARFATQEGVHVFYQPIEQNYNTPEDARWFDASPNWPRDRDRAVRVVRELIGMKQRGLHIANSFAQLEAMIPYFQNPEPLRVTVQAHSAHERRALCSALTTLQLQANGDVTVCTNEPPVGNVRQAPVRQIWARRPPWWEEGCCLERRASAAAAADQLHSIGAPR